MFGWLIFRTRVSRRLLAGIGLCILGGLGLILAVQAARTTGSAARTIHGVAALAALAWISHWIILDEPVSLIQAAGGLAILAGIYTARPR